MTASLSQYLSSNYRDTQIIILTISAVLLIHDFSFILAVKIVNLMVAPDSFHS